MKIAFCLFALAASTADAKPAFAYGVNQNVPAAVGPNYHYNYNAVPISAAYSYTIGTPYVATPVVKPYVAAPVLAPAPVVPYSFGAGVGCKNNQGSFVPCAFGPIPVQAAAVPVATPLKAVPAVPAVDAHVGIIPQAVDAVKSVVAAVVEEVKPVVVGVESL